MLQILNAKRVPELEEAGKGPFRTEFYKPDGSLYAVVQAQDKQPRKDRLSIVINCYIFIIKWK